MHAVLHDSRDSRKVLAFPDLLAAMNGLRIIQPKIAFGAFSFKTCRVTGWYNSLPTYYIQLHWD